MHSLAVAPTNWAAGVAALAELPGAPWAPPPPATAPTQPYTLHGAHGACVAVDLTKGAAAAAYTAAYAAPVQLAGPPAIG